MADETPGMQERMAEAISSAMVDGEFVTKYIVIAEVIDNDGDRALWATANDGATSWDILGLLNWGLARESAATTLRMVAEIEEEEDE